MTTDNELTRRKKQRCFEDWMADDHVLVQLNARFAGVEVPPHLKDNPALTLKMSYRFQGETTTDDDGISTYLKFNGEYFHCVVPWDSVWGLINAAGENTIWPEDVPREVLLQLARAKFSQLGQRLFKRGSSEEKEEKPKPAPALSSVPQPVAPKLTPLESRPAAKPAEKRGDEKTRTGHLKRIK